MPGTPTSRMAIPTINGGADLITTGDDQINAAFAAIDDTAAMDDQGTRASRPVSTSGSPGIVGRYWRSTDGGLDRDTGGGWETIRPGRYTTSVPSVTDNYQEIYFTPAGEPIWRLIWLGGGAGVQGWHFIGGSAWRQEYDPVSVIVATSFANIPGAGVLTYTPHPGSGGYYRCRLTAYVKRVHAAAELQLAIAGGNTMSSVSSTWVVEQDTYAPSISFDGDVYCPAGEILRPVARVVTPAGGVDVELNGVIFEVEPLRLGV